MYEIKNFDDLILPNRITNVINSITSDNIKNYLFSGDKGLGKSSVCDLIVKKLGLPNHYIDLSTEEGRSVGYTEKLEHFIQQKTLKPNTKKIVVIDEVDNISSKFMSVLKKFMDEYKDKVVFLLTTNYPNKVELPVGESRCLPLNFNPTQEEKIEVRGKVGRKITAILEAKNIVIDDPLKKSLKKLLDVTLPDFRNLWNILDTALNVYDNTGKLELDFTGLSSPSVVAEKMYECFFNTQEELKFLDFFTFYKKNAVSNPVKVIEGFIDLVYHTKDIHHDILQTIVVIASEFISRMYGSHNDSIHLTAFLGKSLILTRDLR